MDCLVPSWIMHWVTGTAPSFARASSSGASPSFVYSGYGAVAGPYKDALHISKPAGDGVLVAAMEGLIGGVIPPEALPEEPYVR